MCGIYGTTINYSENTIKEKLKRTAFRGPDHTGLEVFKSTFSQVSLGHNRLSIIDLDARSNQPFSYEGHIHIVFNGEVYNYLEIKASLVSKGYKFNTTSDTEVLCAAYLEFGEDCVNHFIGMFAFVIYDQKRQRLFGARDRLGQKPLYYFHSGKDFEFASQIASIKMDNNRLSISKNAIMEYLNWGYIPDPMSIYSEVKKLQPGNLFTYDLENGDLKISRYWDIDVEGKHRFEGSYEDAMDELENLLTDAVKKRLIADVPLGVFLSGGIDSSLVSALGSKSSEKLKTFSVKFDTKSVDESQYAIQVARHLNTEHHVIECHYDEGLDLIENITHYYDEPFSDSSAIPSMLLSKHTRKHVTVALSGDAGDESFLGYHRYNWIKIAEKFYNLPKFLRPPIIKALRAYPHYRTKVVAGVLSNNTLDESYLNMVGGPADIYSDISEIPGSQYLFHSNKNIYERASDFDLKMYLNGDINTKVDRASMAFSLEVRSPFLDHRIVEFANGLPTDFKFKGKNQKRILKDILFKHVPKDLFNRPKAGFTMPLKEWFRSELKTYVMDNLLNDKSFYDLTDMTYNEAEKMISDHMNGSWNRSADIWSLLVLKQWLSNNSRGLSIT